MSAELLNAYLSDILASFGLILPEAVLALSLFLLLIFDLIWGKRSFFTLFSDVFLAFVFVFTAWIVFPAMQSDAPATTGFSGMIFIGKLSHFFKLIFLLSTFLYLLFLRAKYYQRTHFERKAENHLLILHFLLGLNIMVVASNMLVLVLGLEMVAVSSYALVYFSATDRSKEAALKYFLFGAFSTAMMLYGISLLYVDFASFDLIMLQRLVEGRSTLDLFTSIALILFLFGLFFKIALFPFHIWVPDVYVGSSLPLVSLLSIAPKLAGIFLLGVVYVIFQNTLLFSGAIRFDEFMALLVLITITLGNLAAIWQENVKRMLAYSAIAQTGFILIGLIAFNKSGINALIFYGVTYIPISFAAFMLIDYLIQCAGDKENLQDFSGLGKVYPVLGVSIIIVMASLIGLPPTVGFTAKLVVFVALWESIQANGGSLILISLFVIGLLNVIVSLYYYLKIPYYMFFKNTDAAFTSKLTMPKADQVVIAFLLVIQVYLFFNPGMILNVIDQVNELSYFFR